jgi:hypothetical protein
MASQRVRIAMSKKSLSIKTFVICLVVLAARGLCSAQADKDIETGMLKMAISCGVGEVPCASYCLDSAYNCCNQQPGTVEYCSPEANCCYSNSTGLFLYCGSPDGPCPTGSSPHCSNSTKLCGGKCISRRARCRH